MGITLKDWVDINKNVSDTQRVFYNMSKTMKYIHDKDYCIKSFNPKEIEILDLDKLSPIQFNTVVRIPPEYREEIIKEDIYNLAFIQLGIYSNIPLEYLKPNFIKENFNLFIQYIPESDISYLQGVLERGSTRYYHQYINMANEKQIEKLNQEIGSGSNDNQNLNSLGIQKTKANSVGKTMKATEELYKDLKPAENQSAFVSFLIFPITLAILAMIIIAVIHLVNF